LAYSYKKLPENKAWGAKIDVNLRFGLNLYIVYFEFFILLYIVLYLYYITVVKLVNNHYIP